jgi:hypothetical protein
VFASVIRIQVDVGGLQSQLPSGGHGVARVDDQVHDDLFDLPGIRLDGPESIRGCSHDQNVLADQAAEHFVQVLDQHVEVDHLGLKDLFTTERQEMPGQGCRPLRRGIDMLDVGPDLFFPPGIVQDHAAVALNHREQVIEVMRQATSQPAHCFHLLGLPQLLFEHALFSDIGNEADEMAGFFRSIDNEMAFILDREIRAVFFCARGIRCARARCQPRGYGPFHLCIFPDRRDE